MKDLTQIWDSPMTSRLAAAFIDIDSTEVMQKLLRDVMTEKEIIEISARLEAASMLSNGSKYTDIIVKTKLSSRTIARISDWMQNGSGGYSLVLGQSNNHHTHIPPASAA